MAIDADGILTLSEARKILEEIRIAKSGKKPNTDRAIKLGAWLGNAIMHTIGIHGDHRSRNLVAILRELEALK